MGSERYKACRRETMLRVDSKTTRSLAPKQTKPRELPKTAECSSRAHCSPPTERQHLAAMGTLLLDIALFVSAALLIPPAFIVASKGPIDGIKELFGEDFVTAYDEDSYFLKHAMMIDCSKNWFLAALYLAAITFDAAAKEKVAILAILLMRDPAQ